MEREDAAEEARRMNDNRAIIQEPEPLVEDAVPENQVVARLGPALMDEVDRELEMDRLIQQIWGPRNAAHEQLRQNAPLEVVEMFELEQRRARVEYINYLDRQLELNDQFPTLADLPYIRRPGFNGIEFRECVLGGYRVLQYFYLFGEIVMTPIAKPEPHLAGLPADLILKIFTSMDKNSPGNLRAASKQFNSLYEKNESEIPWPSFSYTVHLDIDYTDRIWSTKLTMTKNSAGRETLTLQEPRLKQIAKYLFSAHHVLIRLNKIPTIFDGRSWEHGKLKRLLEKSTVKSLFLMMDHGNSSTHVFEVQNLFPLLKTFQTTFTPVDFDSARQILTKDLQKICMEVTYYFPLYEYIEEWKQGRRTITYWCFSFHHQERDKPAIRNSEFSRDFDNEKLSLKVAESPSYMIVYLLDSRNHF